MPVNIHRHKARIYVSQWLENVLMDELVQATQAIHDLATSHNEADSVVVIVDGSKATHIPFEIRQLQSMIRNRSNIIAYLLVDPPLGGQIASRILDGILEQSFAIFNDMEEAEAHADELLADIN